MYKSITKVSMMQSLYKTVNYVASSKEALDTVTVILSLHQKKNLKKIYLAFRDFFIKLTFQNQARTHTEHLTNFHVKINFRHLMLVKDIKS